MKAKLDFVLDGTFSHSMALDNITRALEKGYTVKVYFIHQEPQIAWQFTQDRGIVEHRSIDRTEFMETYSKLYVNMENLIKSYKGVAVSIILKDTNNRIGKQHEAVQNIYDVVSRPLASDQLSHVIVV